jgi:xanthine dehydrogenase molybdopterin-binding subunit B
MQKAQASLGGRVMRRPDFEIATQEAAHAVIERAVRHQSAIRHVKEALLERKTLDTNEVGSLLKIEFALSEASHAR